jgi:hypothetical protein
MGFFAGIGQILSGVGTAIMEGFKALGNLITQGIGFVADFIGKIPGMLKAGFEHVTGFVKSVFGGDSAGIKEAIQATGSPDAFNAGVNSAAGMTISEQIAGVGATPTVAPSLAGASIPKGLQTVSAGGDQLFVGGLMGETAKGGLLGGKDLFGTAIDFFKTDAGNMVGKAATTVAAMAYQRSATRNAQKMAESEARRQEEERRRMVMLEQQRQSDLTKYQHTRENEIARAGQANMFAGFRGSWIDPTTNVPAPVQL